MEGQQEVPPPTEEETGAAPDNRQDAVHQQQQQLPTMQQPPMYHYPMMTHPMQGPIPMHHGYHHPHPATYHHPHMPPSGMEGIALPAGIPGSEPPSDPLEAVLGPFPCARLRGLPFDASLEDVLVFFQGLVVLDVVMHHQGEAFVVFANPMDFQMALQRDRQSIGRRYIEVFPGKRADYYSAIAGKHWHAHDQLGQQLMGQGEGGFATAGGIGERYRGDIDPQSDSWGVPTTRTPLHDDEQQGLSQQYAGQAPAHGGGGKSRTRSSSGGAHDASRDSSRSPATMSGRGGGRPGSKRGTGGGIQVGEHTGYLRMRGLPFTSTKKDIYEFFKGRNIVDESVVLTYRSDGRATGEGYAEFKTPDDAKDAMSLHKNSMGNRYIELFISNKDEHSRAMQRFGGR